MTDTKPAGIGDINGTTRGSGARFNAGKPDLSLMPLRVVADWMANERPAAPETCAMRSLGRFQETHDPRFLAQAIAALGIVECAREGAKTFDYGKRKYSAWNWLRGMAWSVPLACAARHLLKMHEDVMLDDESGETHRGHVAANITMLMVYVVTYRDGNDLPDPALFVPHGGQS